MPSRFARPATAVAIASVLGLAAIVRGAQEHRSAAHKPAQAERTAAPGQEIARDPAPAPLSGAPSRLQPADAQPGDDPLAAVEALVATPKAIWAGLIEGNRRFIADEPRAKDLDRRRAELEKGQHPSAIVLGCADSRVGPELVFDAGLGELFVVRTAGNVAGPVALGSIEYAVEHLDAHVLVVLGHEKCGAVAAAALGGAMPTPNLEAIVRRISPSLEYLSTCFSGDELVRRGVEANVHRSARDLVAESPILAAGVETGGLTIIKAVYHLGSGQVVPLE